MSFPELLHFLAQVGQAVIIKLLLGIVVFFIVWKIRNRRQNPREGEPFFYIISLFIRMGGFLLLVSSIGAFIGTEIASFLQLPTPYKEACKSFCIALTFIIGLRFWFFTRTQ